MDSLPFEGFDLFPRIPEDVCFGGFGPVQSATMLGGEGGELVSTPERPWKKVVTSEARAAVALKSHREALNSHSEAERRRRERINAHLSTLRSLVPGSDKLNKAGLLAEVINYVRELKVSASEIRKECNVPAEADEVKVEVYGDGSDAGNLSIKASLCCEDRPELLTDLRRTVQSLHLKTVKAEISTLGGRVKTVFVLTCEGTGNGIKHRTFTNSVHQALNSVLERVSSPSDFSPSSHSCKRRRLSSF